MNILEEFWYGNIEPPLCMQRAISRMNEIAENDVHVFEYKESKGSIVAVVLSLRNNTGLSE